MNSDSQNSDALNNKTKVLILQHPQEKKEALATVPLLLQNLKNIELKIGLSWPNLKKILGTEIDYSKWGVIHLGTQAESEELFKSGKEVVYKGKVKNLSELQGLVVLDGSWREVKALWWRNAWLLKLTRIALNPKKPSIYSTLRREPRKQSLSTLEAVALVLQEIEPDKNTAEVLNSKLEQFIKLAR